MNLQPTLLQATTRFSAARFIGLSLSTDCRGALSFTSVNQALSGPIELACYMGPIVLPLLLLPFSALSDGRRLNWWIAGYSLNGVVSFATVFIGFELVSCSHAEVGSTWCWYASSMCLWFWCEVRLYRWLVDPLWTVDKWKAQHCQNDRLTQMTSWDH